MGIHRSGGSAVSVTPNFAEEFIARNHASGVLCQELQCLELLGRYRNLLTAATDLCPEKIYRNILKDIHVFPAAAGRTPDQRTQPRNQFHRAEWYGYVIVGALLQEKVFFRNIGSGTEN